MGVFSDIHHLPDFKNAVVTIGTFDGVHLGHKEILKEVVNYAKMVNGESVLITFDPHPRKLLFPNQQLGLLTPLATKINLILNAGIEHIVVMPFTKEFAQKTANEYIINFISGLFHPHTIIIGYDHRFGCDRKGDINLLKQFGPNLGYQVKEIPAQLIDDAAISSTKIRNFLILGQISNANKMLGRFYSLAGIVVHGNKLGRTIGYPTANIKPNDSDQLLPALGIYAIKVIHNNNTYCGMLNIGYNPTVTDKKELRIEANIFDFNEDIYGQNIEILFIEKTRDEQKFGSLIELKDQLHRDKMDAIRINEIANI